MNFLQFRKLKGFTLIELLVVIAIIGILAGIVVANLSKARKLAKRASALATAKQIQTSAELFYEGNKTYNNLCQDPEIKNLFNKLNVLGTQPVPGTNGMANCGNVQGGQAYYFIVTVSNLNSSSNQKSHICFDSEGNTIEFNAGWQGTVWYNNLNCLPFANT